MAGIIDLPLGPLLPQRFIPDMYVMKKYTPLPDTCNSAPVISFRRRKVNQKTEVKAEFTSRKPMSPAPWCAVKSSYPCSLPQSSLHSASLPEAMLAPKQRLRCCRGNLLQGVKCSSDQYRFIAANNTLDGSKVTVYSACLQQHSNGNQLLALGHQATFNKDVSLNDIQCSLLDNEVIMLARSHHQVDIHKFSANSLEYCNEDLKSKVHLTSACLSPVFSGYWLQSDELQKVSLYSCSRNKPIWTNMIPDISNKGKNAAWCSAVFGYGSAHQCLLGNRTSIYTGDFRKKKLEKLADLKGLEIVDEVQCGMVVTPGKPYLFSVLSDQVLLLDQRNCRQPVLSWRHMMIDLPRRTLLHSLPDLDLLLLGNNVEHKVGLMGVRGCGSDWESGERHIQSVSLVTNYDLITPMKTFANKKNLWFDTEVSSRLKNDTTGVSIHGIQGSKNFNLLVSNELGDIFCQNFTLSSSSDPLLNNSFVANHDLDIIDKMKSWEDSVISLTSSDSDSKVTCDVELWFKNGVSKLGEKISRSLKDNNYAVRGDIWHVKTMVEMCRETPKHKLAMENKKTLEWVDILLDEFDVDQNHITQRVPYHLPLDPIKKHFSSRADRSMRPERLQSRADAQGKIVLSHWPLGQHADEMDITKVSKQSRRYLEQYRAIPYSRKLNGRTSKYRPRDGGSNSSSGGSSKCSTHKSTAATEVMSGGAFGTASYWASDAENVGSEEEGKSAEPCEPGLQDFLNATAQINLTTLLPELQQGLLSTPRPSVAGLSQQTPSGVTPITVPASIRKKKSRNAGF